MILPLYVFKFLKERDNQKARAQEANRAKTTFLANMSHEIRTPLNGIVGVVDLFQATVMSPQQTELARLMRHSVSVLRSLVDDVLDITKIEAGRISIEVVFHLALISPLGPLPALMPGSTCSTLPTRE